MEEVLGTLGGWDGPGHRASQKVAGVSPRRTPTCSAHDSPVPWVAIADCDCSCTDTTGLSGRTDPRPWPNPLLARVAGG